VKDALGKSTVYKGVLVRDILASAGLILRWPRALGSYVIVDAVEEPHVLFALAEFDTALTQPER
jgi:hypothetical protein